MNYLKKDEALKLIDKARALVLKEGVECNDDLSYIIVGLDDVKMKQTSFTVPVVLKKRCLKILFGYHSYLHNLKMVTNRNYKSIEK